MLFLNKLIRHALFYFVSIALIPSGMASQSSSQDNAPIQTTRLVTDADHKNFLIETLNAAKKSVMISSYDVSPTIFQNDNIAGSIINAANRGVKVYIYFEHPTKRTVQEIHKLKALESYCAKFEVNCNHSKCVLKDNDTVAIGSYNWLSHFNDTGSNATIVTTGALASHLKEDVWQGMRFYQSRQYGNDKGMDRFYADGDTFTPKIYELGAQSWAASLRTPEAHGIFLNQAFETAQSNIYIFSPFIRFHKLKDTFAPAILRSLNERKIRTVLVTSPNAARNQTELLSIFALLDEMHRDFPYFSYQKQKDFHAKTLVSDNLICEGSFNWLSAVSETDHEANNYEVSVAFKGDFAMSLLRSFHQSALGRVVALPEIIDVDMGNTHASLEKAANSNNLIFPTIPADFDKHIKIFSGAKFKKQGFCVKLDADYIRDYQNSTIYFNTEAEAKQAAYDKWLETSPAQQQQAKHYEKKRERVHATAPAPSKPKKAKSKATRAPTIPDDFDRHIKIYSGARFGYQGFCVKLNGQYIVNDTNKTAYFEDERQAKQVAYDAWKATNSNNRLYQ